MSIPWFLLLCISARAEPAADPEARPITTAVTPSVPGPFTCTVDPYIAVRAGETVDMRVSISVPSGTKLYRDEISIEVVQPAGLLVGPVAFPASQPYDDPWGGVSRQVYAENVDLSVPLTVPAAMSGRVDLTVEVAWQGCAADMCYMPGGQTFNVPVRVARRR